MLEYPILAFFLLLTVRATPTGNHTCTGVVKHEVTVRVNVTEPVTFRAYEWCLRVPPRCSTYTVQLKDRVKIHKEMHNRTITVCCKGYVEIDYKCVPACPPDMECPNMHCNRTNHCYCTPGYTGLYCDHPCPKGVWGAGCIKECDCPSGYTCHHLTGDCMLDDTPPPKMRKTTTRAAAEEAIITNPTTTMAPLTTNVPTTTTTTTTTTPKPTTVATTIPTTTTTPPPTNPPTPKTIRTTERTAATTTTSTIPEPTTSTTEKPTEPLATFPSSAITTTTAALTETVPTTEQPTTTSSTINPTTLLQTTKAEATIEKTDETLLQSPKFDDFIKQPTTAIVTEATTLTQAITTEATTLTQATTAKATTNTKAASTTEATTTTKATTTTESATKLTTIEATTTTEATTPATKTPEATTTKATTIMKATTIEATTTEPSTTSQPTTSTIASIATHTEKAEPTTTTMVSPATSQPLTIATEVTFHPTKTQTNKEKISPGLKWLDPFETAQITRTSNPKTVPTTESTSTIPQTTTETLTSIPSTSANLPVTDSDLFQATTKVPPQTTAEKTFVWQTKETSPPISTMQPTTAQETNAPTEQAETRQTQTNFGLDDILSRNKIHQVPQTTDRLDRLIIEDVHLKPTTDTSPIKLVEEVISKYFPDLKASHEPSKKKMSQEELIPVEKVAVAKGSAKSHNLQSVVEQTGKNPEKQDNEKFKKVASSFTLAPRHRETFPEATTSTPTTTPKLSTIPVITPKVIVSAKNPDEIDLGGVIYRKMTLFPPMRKTETPSTSPPQTTSANTAEKSSLSSAERFKIYLPEFAKESKEDDTVTESPVKTFMPKFNYDKEEFDFGKQQLKKSKPKEKDLKKYKSKTYDFTLAPTSAEDVSNERVTNNVFLETKEFKVHLASTKAQKFDSFYSKSPFESSDDGYDRSKKKGVDGDMTTAGLFKFTDTATGLLPSETSDDGLDQPTTNPKPPHTWYSHAREKAKIKNALKVVKSTTVDMNGKPPTEHPLGNLDESNDINSMVTNHHDDQYSSEREARSAMVTYNDDLVNPLMLRGHVNFNAESLASSSWIAQEAAMFKSATAITVAIIGTSAVVLTAVAVALWMRSRANQEESSAPEDGTSNSDQQHYETLYPLTQPVEEMEVATFFCPTFTNNYAERINKEFSELSYDHPRTSCVEPLYAEILHPKIRDAE